MSPLMALSGQSSCASVCPLLDQSGQRWILARDGLSANDPMYGPAVRCKWILPSWRGAVLHQCIRPLIGACCAPGHHGYQRACDLISGKASSGPFGSSVFACAGKTEPPSRFILSQTSAGKVYRSGYVIVGSSLCALAAFLGVESRSSRLGGGLTDFPYFEVPAMSQNAPSDAGQLVGERNREHVGVQPLLGRLDPGFEPVTLPALWLDQHNPRRLHEQDA